MSIMPRLTKTVSTAPLLLGIIVYAVAVKPSPATHQMPETDGRSISPDSNTSKRIEEAQSRVNAAESDLVRLRKSSELSPRSLAVS